MSLKDILYKLLIVSVLTLVATHLSFSSYFPLNSNYEFPVAHFSLTLLEGILAVFIIDGIYSLFERYVFKKKIDLVQVIWFLMVCNFAIGLVYSISYPLIIDYLNYSSTLYYYMVGLLLTLVFVTLLIIIFYSKKFVELFSMQRKEGKLKIKSGRKTYLIPIHEIHCFISKYKTVFLVDKNGKKVTTSFTLNELEGQLDKNFFFRANRQCIVHINGISSVVSGTNDKLIVNLKEEGEIEDTIVVSRYKAVAFKTWMENSYNLSLG